MATADGDGEGLAGFATVYGVAMQGAGRFIGGIEEEQIGGGGGYEEFTDFHRFKNNWTTFGFGEQGYPEW